MTASIVANALEDALNYFEALPELANEAAYLAINQAARDTVPAARAEMYSQVAFPRGYLSNERFGVTRRANKGKLQAVIAGRDRPTSLARFAPGANRENSKGRPILVQVKRGKSIALKRAFFVNLRNGNTGLAVRLPDGQTLDNSQAAVRLDNNVYLLYGPSVDQVFRSVADDLSPDILEKVSENFRRQISRLNARG